ncbi:MAG TPA: tetratricopeptide repeat protein [Bacteroidia bacterium]|nr:tetratricopeptide repeat protein [Bacteroidia bacterium]
MKRVLLFLLLQAALSGYSQNMQVQNMINYTRNKDYVKAKAAADAAAVHESTSNSPKMWMNRGHVYKAIYADTSQKVRELDPEAEEKSLEAYINCLKLDKDNIYKDEVKGDLVRAASVTKRKADKYYKPNKMFEPALRAYDLLEQALPYDFDQGLKRNNITKEYLIYDKYDLYMRWGDKPKAKQYANTLIDMKYKEPRIYIDMMNMALKEDKDTAAALAYIEKGKLLFEDNMLLIGTEIDIYIAQKKTPQLIEKLKAAIELSPDNEVLHAVLGQVYQKSGDIPNAEKEYLKALELKPDYETVNYNLGALYFNEANEYNKKLNDLPPGQSAKVKEYEEKVKTNFQKAIPYLEKAYEANKNEKAYSQRLYQAYMRLGDTENAKKYKPAPASK